MNSTITRLTVSAVALVSTIHAADFYVAPGGLDADPLFVNPEQGDFTLRPESPALALGFQPIDLSRVGPRINTGPQQ